MSEDETLQFDETALCLLTRLQLLYEDAHAWFQDVYRAHVLQKNQTFFRLTDIAIERDQVSLDLSDHITYVLLSDQPYKTGTPGISLIEALFIKGLVNNMHQGLSSEMSVEKLHDKLRALKLIT